MGHSDIRWLNVCSKLLQKSIGKTQHAVVDQLHSLHILKFIGNIYFRIVTMSKTNTTKNRYCLLCLKNSDLLQTSSHPMSLCRGDLCDCETSPKVGRELQYQDISRQWACFCVGVTAAACRPPAPVMTRNPRPEPRPAGHRRGVPIIAGLRGP